MTKKANKPAPDFLTQNFDTTDAPAIPVAILPFFQFNAGAEVFEFPLVIAEKTNGKSVEKPIWSRILRDTGLKTKMINHNGCKGTEQKSP